MTTPVDLPDDSDELWEATVRGELDEPEPDLGYFPGEDE